MHGSKGLTLKFSKMKNKFFSENILHLYSPLKMWFISFVGPILKVFFVLVEGFHKRKIHVKNQKEKKVENWKLHTKLFIFMCITLSYYLKCVLISAVFQKWFMSPNFAKYCTLNDLLKCSNIFIILKISIIFDSSQKQVQKSYVGEIHMKMNNLVCSSRSSTLFLFLMVFNA